MRVKLEIVPHGFEAEMREIGRLDIFNEGLDAFGHHRYGVIELTPKLGGLHDQRIYHRRQLGAWALVSKALKQLEITGP